MAIDQEKGIVQEIQNIHLAIAQLRIAIDDMKKNFEAFENEEVSFKKAKYRNDAEKHADDFIRRLLSSFFTFKSVNDDLANLVNEFVEFLSVKSSFGLEPKVKELSQLLKNNMGYAKYLERIYRNFGLLEEFEEIPDELPAEMEIPAERPAHEEMGKPATSSAHKEVFQSFKIKCEDINDSSRFTRLIGKVYKDCCEKYNVFVMKEVRGEWLKARRASDVLPFVAHEMENAAKGRDGYVRFQVIKENSDYTVNIEYAGK